ncbi:MAG: hypothetical protein GWN39_15995, partial [Thermoplasmata archaeon]|nr:fibronectin type III domain-containing protein [Thermoplasmata archaeon]NIV80202.1 hypothetical protein [Thermoplasmata archaeon]NIY05368.1 hypothetical protein [Thermoplasmata archaeon]
METGAVNVSWSPPVYDGGEILGYKVFRRISTGVYVLLLTVEDELWALDDDPKLVLGEEYYYTVRAFNTMGDGPEGLELAI